MSSRTQPKTVILGGTPRHAEGVAANGPITPGMLLSVNTGGTVRPNNDTSDTAVRYVAREADFIGASIDDQYENGELVPYWIAQPGDRFYMFLEQNADTTPATLLESNGAGLLQPVTQTEGVVTGKALFRSLETIDNTPGTGPVRIKVEAI